MNFLSKQLLGLNKFRTNSSLKEFLYRSSNNFEYFWGSIGGMKESSKEEINQAQIDIVKLNNLKEAYIRPMCFYGSGSLGLRADNLKVHTIVAAWEWPSYMAPEVFEKGIKVKISSYKRERGNLVSRSKVNGNYVKSMMALKEALKEGYDEALFLDTDNFISER